jgi:cytochrome c biogenesis protein CcdA/thiol-disulfide isomerase/thioredoxin
MALLVPIAFVAGLVTAFTPCILPVLPIVLAGGTSRRPLAIAAGLVTTFTLFTLAGAWIFSSLGLSARWQTRVGVAVLLLLALTLAVPRVGTWLERPFAFMTRRSGRDLGGGFLLGASLGLVFTPCAGPVFAAVSVNAGTHRVGFSTVVVALAYACGFAVPILLIALGGRGIATRLRANAQPVRYVAAAAIAVAAVVIWEGWATGLQTKVPGYADAIQKAVENNGAAKKRLARLEGRGGTTKLERASETAKLQDFGRAPDFAGISTWLNTPRPLSLPRLRGRVVLIDFWTYSCVNCLRTLPHLEAWDRAYRKHGLTIVGVHTPEFAFEHVRSNVSDAVRKLGVRYPVGLDNGYGTWNAYANQYWPAEYLIDRNGHVRHVHFGEGDYGGTEMAIRTLLAEPGKQLGRMASVPDTTPRDLATPESYLGAERLDRFASPGGVIPNVKTIYRFPSSLPQNDLAYAGEWTVRPQKIVAGRAARLRLHFHARHVYLVLGGSGDLGVVVNGKPVKSVRVRGFSRLYTLLSYPQVRDAVLELRFTPGLEGYAFTFG